MTRRTRRSSRWSAGVLTEHVMEVGQQGDVRRSEDAGRQSVDDALSQLSQTSGLPADQQRALGTMLHSVQDFYNQPGADDAGGRDAQAPGLSMPYSTHEEAVTSGANVAYNGYAHAFAGMGIQFLLFAATSLGIEILLERQRGLWKRLRSAPISRLSLLLIGKTVSMTIVSMMTLLVSFAIAMIVFRVRIAGSVIGFLAVSVACSLMAATFGLLVAALGETPSAGARGQHAGRADDGDARRRVGPDVHLSEVAAAGDARRPRALGRGWPRRDDVARHRPVRRRSCRQPCFSPSPCCSAAFAVATLPLGRSLAAVQSSSNGEDAMPSIGLHTSRR